jgi:hypothetical protein
VPQTRISAQAHLKLRRLAEELGETSEQVLDRALNAFERDRLLDAINAGYAVIKGDPAQWEADRKEHELWDVTLSDGDAI